MTPDSGDAVRAEAERLARRLAVARTRLGGAAQPDPTQPDPTQPTPTQPTPTQPRAVHAAARVATRADAPGARGSEMGTVRGFEEGAGAGARIESADDEVRSLLSPALARISRLADLAEALADGSLSESDAVDAVAELAAEQPVRRPR